MPDQTQQTRFERERVIAALDQSDGCTSKPLRMYGIDELQYSSQAQMFDLIPATRTRTRTRIITSPLFTGDRILGAILQGTLDREIDGMGVPEYLWERREFYPF